jgi:membrane-bound lytic murein transglycosylase MltF
VSDTAQQEVPVLKSLLATALVAFATAAAAQPAPQPAAPAAGAPPAQAPRKLNIANKPWQGDFDRMLERRMIRVAAPYSRSLYFNDKGRERGLAADLVRDFEQWINRKYAKQLGKRPVTVYLYPATRDKLLPELGEGLADISIGNLTVTEERLKTVDFVAPDDQARMDEILVAGPTAPPVATIGDLSGKTVHVREASSYHASLQALNGRLRQEGRPEVNLIRVPDALEDEDMLELMNAGLIGLMVVDDWKAKMWAQVLPKIKVRADIVLRDDGKTGWAIRKGSPKLAAEIEDFHVGWVRKHGLQRTRLASYMKRVKSLKDPTGSDEWKRFGETLVLFEKYGNRYGFDPLMLAAQGYQESQLNQEAKSHVGAIGVMQLMPATGAEMKVGDIKAIEPNIHAGAKYMDQLMTKFFPDANFSPGNRPLFAFASYNAGPGNISKCRKEAAKRGLDPDKWFNNVEIVVAEKIGTETTTYVRNIYKYYVAYRLTLEAREQADKARRQVAPA